MPDTAWFTEQSDISFKRLLPRIEAVLDGTAEGDIFLARLRSHFPTIFRLLYQLYEGCA